MAKNNNLDNLGQAPIGSIVQFDFTPDYGWLDCDGDTLTTTDYPELFAMIGYEYGGSGTSFDLPTASGYIINYIGLTYTSEPITWTQRTSNFGTAYMTAGAYGSDGNYCIAGGYEGSSTIPRIITETNPTNAWDLSTSTGLSGYFEHALSYDGTYWIATTGSGIYYASDPTGAFTQASSVDIASGIYSTAALSVAGSSNDTSLYVTSSAVTTTWTQRSSPFSGSRIFTVGYDGSSYWIMAGISGNIYYSTTPTNDATWTSATSIFGSSTIQSIAYGNGYWTAVAADGKIGTCEGIPSGTWTLHASSSFGTDAIRSVAYGDGAWAACGNAGKIATCGAIPSGTWTQQTSSFGGSDTLWTIFYGNGYWVCGGGNAEEGKVATAVNGL